MLYHKLRTTVTCLKQLLKQSSPSSQSSEAEDKVKEKPPVKSFSTPSLFFHLGVFSLFTFSEIAIDALTSAAYTICDVSSLRLWDYHRRIFIWFQFTFFYRTKVHDPFSVVLKSNAGGTDKYIFASAHFHGDLDRAAIQYSQGIFQFCRTVSVVQGRFSREVEHCIPLIKSKPKKVSPKNASESNPYIDAMVRSLCEDRKPLWIAPEGKINETPRLLTLHSGLARIALKCCMKGSSVCSAVHIVPTLILFECTSQFRSQVIIEFGDPIRIALSDYEICTWNSNVKCAAGRQRVAAITQQVKEQLVRISSLCPVSSGLQFDNTTSDTNTHDFLQLSKSRYRLPVPRKIKKKDQLIQSTINQWWLVRIIDMCYLFHYLDSHGNLAGCNWYSRVTNLRYFVASIDLSKAPLYLMESFQEVFSLVQKFDAMYHKLTGQEAFRSAYGLWWGCGQHMKMHLRANSSRSCISCAKGSASNVSYVMAYRRCLHVLRNFTSSVKVWKQVLDSYSEDSVALDQAIESFSKLRYASLSLYESMQDLCNS